jgi:hypothetical protein
MKVQTCCAGAIRTRYRDPPWADTAARGRGHGEICRGHTLWSDMGGGGYVGAVGVPAIGVDRRVRRDQCNSLVGGREIRWWTDRFGAPPEKPDATTTAESTIPTAYSHADALLDVARAFLDTVPGEPVGRGPHNGRRPRLRRQPEPAERKQGSAGTSQQSLPERVSAIPLIRLRSFPLGTLPTAQSAPDLPHRGSGADRGLNGLPNRLRQHPPRRNCR